QDAQSAMLSGGSDSRVRVTGDLNHAIESIDGAALRLNVVYDKGDRPSRDVADFQKWGVAPAFALGLGTQTRAYFNYLFLKQGNTPDGGIPTVGLIGYTGNNASAAVNAALNSAAPVRRENYYGSSSDYENVTTNMFTARLEHDFSDSTTIRNTSRYGRNTLDRLLTGTVGLANISTGTGATALPTSPAVWQVARSRQRRDEVTEILTNQTNLTSVFSTGSVGHSISTGVEFLYENSLVRGYTAAGTTPAANLYAPNRADPMSGFIRNGGATEGNTVTGAVYAFDTLQFSEQWLLNVGVRFDHYRTESTSVPATATPPAASTFIEGSGNLLTYKTGLIFKPVETGSIYLAYASSEQPPGGANFTLNAGATNVNNPNLDPQEAVNIELGTKWEFFDRRLMLTGAVFDTRNKNDLATQDPVTLVVTQLGERKVRGVELGASGSITPNWQINAGISKLDTEVTEGTTGAANATQGAALTYTPDLTFTTFTTYRFPFGLTVGGGARYTDAQFRNGSALQATQTQLAVNPDAWVFDLMASYAISEKASLQFNAYNIADEFYLSTLNNGGSRYTLGAPRTFLLSAKLAF
ncbi:MAG: TonB-dependent receptor, partial [Steroidobacteraceae bacterium]